MLLVLLLLLLLQLLLTTVVDDTTGVTDFAEVAAEANYMDELHLFHCVVFQGRKFQ